MNKNIEVLEEVIDLLESEKKKFYNLVNQNNFRIEEINSYLQELSKREDDDFKVFSPRNVENMHREQIEADIYEKKKYEEENVAYNKKIESLKVLIDKVNVVIGNLQIEAEKRYAEDKNIESENFNNIKFAEDNANRMDDVVENNRKENSNKVVTDEENINIDIQNLIKENRTEKQHIAHQILNCVSFITLDTERAKIELTALARKMIEY